MREKILTNLSKEKFVSGQEIAKKLKISRTAVFKHIKALRKLGYVIESVPRKGYRLIASSKSLHPLVLRKCLKTSFIGHPVIHFDQVASTINQIMLKAEKSDEGLVVVAEKQSKGRGRFGRQWFSPRGGIWSSILVKPNRPTAEAARLNIIASLAIAEAIEKITGLDIQIKWPNDVTVDGIKVAGVLTEMVGELDRINFAVVSFGIDVNNKIPSELAKGEKPLAISLKEVLGTEVDRVALFCLILKLFEDYYIQWQESDFTPILRAWEKRCLTLGKKIKIKGVSKVLEGKAAGIDENGQLILKTDDDKKHVLSAGEVTILKG